MDKFIKICGLLCLLCIILGVILSLVMIWGDVSSEVAWKSWATLFVFFFASLGVGSLLQFGGKYVKGKNDES